MNSFEEVVLVCNLANHVYGIRANIMVHSATRQTDGLVDLVYSMKDNSQQSKPLKNWSREYACTKRSFM